MRQTRRGMGALRRRRRARALTGSLLALSLVSMAAPHERSFDSPAAAASARRAGGASGESQRVWVALEDEQRLALVDVTRGRVVRKLAVRGRPHNLVANRDGVVASALWDNRRIAIRRPGTLEHVYLGGAPHDVKMGGGRIVVANQGSNRLQLVSFRGRKKGKILLRANPHDVAIAPSGRVAWASLEGTDQMVKVGLRGRVVLRYLSTGRSPHDLLFSPTGRLWVTDWHGAVHVYSRRGRLLKTRRLGIEAHHLAFTRDGDQVWITDHGAHRVFVLGTRKLRILKEFPIAGAPHHVTITRDGRKAVVADHDRGLLVVYRVRTLRRVGRIPVGAGPHGVWSVP